MRCIIFKILMYIFPLLSCLLLKPSADVVLPVTTPHVAVKPAAGVVPFVNPIQSSK